MQAAATGDRAVAAGVGARGWGPGLFWGTVGLGLGLGYSNYYYGAGPWYPGYVVADPQVITYDPPPPAPAPVVPAVPPVAAAPAAPQEPVIYPRTGQSAAQLQADYQACRHWASEQRGAITDGSIMARAVWACMDGRGYTLR